MYSSLRRASVLVRAASSARRSGGLRSYSDYFTKRPIKAGAASATGLGSTKSAGESLPPPVEARNAAPVAVDCPRPSEIPYQAKVANTVNLIGRVHMPVQFQFAPDGKFWAGTVIAQDFDSLPDTVASPLWIPVLFEGDLAHVAACHLKEHDRVHIGGQLSSDPLPFNVTQGQANVQVMVQNINFVEGGSYRVKTSSICNKYGKVAPNIRVKDDNVKDAVSEQDTPSIDELTSPTKLDEKQVVKICPDVTTKNNIWRDLLDNPKEWLDYRTAKLDGSVKQKYPDFKRKDGTVALWLNEAPKGVLSNIKGIEFDAETSKSNPNFGRELQVNDDNVKDAVSEQDMLPIDELTSPTKLDEKQVVKIWPGGTPKNDTWRDLVENPKEWLDYRTAKVDGSVNQKHPDFKRKDRTVALWLNAAPKWVLSNIEEIGFDVGIYKSNSGREQKGDEVAKKISGDEAWKNLVQNPEEWLDNRLDKLVSSHPDFKHKQTGKALWLKWCPSWVLPKLPPLKSKEEFDDPRQRASSSTEIRYKPDSSADGGYMVI